MDRHERSEGGGCFLVGRRFPARPLPGAQIPVGIVQAAADTKP